MEEEEPSEYVEPSAVSSGHRKGIGYACQEYYPFLQSWGELHHPGVFKPRCFEIKANRFTGGKAMYAARDIRKGEMILIDSPRVLCEWGEWQGKKKRMTWTHCAFCQKSLTSRIEEAEKEEYAWNDGIVECKGGCGFLFCSSGCRDTLWVTAHAAMCPGEHAMLVGDDADDNTLLPLAPIRTPEQYRAHLELYVAMAPGTYGGLYMRGAYSLLSWAIMRVRRGMSWEMAFGPLEYFYHRPYSVCVSPQEGLKDCMASEKEAIDKVLAKPFALLMRSLPEDAWKKELTLEMFDQLCGTAFLNIFVRNGALYAIKTCINHSCEPNVWVTEEGELARSLVCVQASRMIPKGQEICVNYIRITPDREANRKLLRKNFLFHCFCPSCRKYMKECGKAGFHKESPEPSASQDGFVE